MFYSLTGKVVHKDGNSICISCGGVAYRCYTSSVTLGALSGKEEATVYTYLHVRENVMELYGFHDEDELEWFKLLITVNGVGTKAASLILSQFTAERLFLILSSGDSKSLTTVSGIGNKIAQKIILELKSKVQSKTFTLKPSSSVEVASPVGESSNLGEAIEALVMLGYSQTDASVAVSDIDPSLMVQDIIKGALKKLSSPF